MSDDQESTHENEKLDKDLNEKRAELDSLNNQLNETRSAMKSEIDALSSEKIDLTTNLSGLKQQIDVTQSELDALTKQREELNSDIQKHSTEKQEHITAVIEKAANVDSLNSQISNLTQELNNLQASINSQNAAKNILAGELTTVQTNLTETKEKLNSLVSESNTYKEKIESQKVEHSSFETKISDLKEKYGLYSKDMAEMSKDSTTQLNIYSASAIASIGVTIILMLVLLCFLANSNPFSESIKDFFPKSPDLRFLSVLTIRISISAAFVFLIVVFLNLSRGFISQYIKTRNRLTALRVADFLIDRLQSKKISYSSEEEKTKIEIEQIKEQVALLNIHIPKIMDLGTSSFDKTSRTKTALARMKEFKELA